MRKKKGQTPVERFDSGRKMISARCRYHALKHEDRQRLRVRRRGKKHFERKPRSPLFNELPDGSGPGTRYEIDATSLDLMVCSTHDSGSALGRVSAYIVIDKLSREIVGCHLALERGR
jgi:transposase InsO family protein